MQIHTIELKGKEEEASPENPIQLRKNRKKQTNTRLLTIPNTRRRREREKEEK